MMKKITPIVLFATALVAGSASLFAADAKKKQKMAPLPGAGTGGNTPHATTSAVIDNNRITLVYGRPFTKHPRTGQVRQIWGSLVPYGKIWRTGSDEATLLITQQPLQFGNVNVPAGAYTLWTLPNNDGTAKLIINRQIGQWGVPRPGQNPKEVYDEGNDVGRVDLEKASLEKSVDQFTMAIERNPAGGGILKLMWENTQFSVPFTVKKA